MSMINISTDFQFSRTIELNKFHNYVVRLEIIKYSSKDIKPTFVQTGNNLKFNFGHVLF